MVKKLVKKEYEYIGIVYISVDSFILDTMTMSYLDFLKYLELNQVQKSLDKCEI